MRARKVYYAKDKHINDVIWHAINEAGFVSRTYLMRKCQISDKLARELVKELPKITPRRLKHYFRNKYAKEKVL